jgi:uncharacterized protein (DUF1499 family)
MAVPCCEATYLITSNRHNALRPRAAGSIKGIFVECGVSSMLQAAQSALKQACVESQRKEMFHALEPEMEFLRRMRERMGERYPEAMFLPPVLVDEAEKDRMIKAMRVSSSRIAATLCV